MNKNNKLYVKIRKLISQSDFEFPESSKKKTVISKLSKADNAKLSRKSQEPYQTTVQIKICISLSASVRFLAGFGVAISSL